MELTKYGANLFKSRASFNYNDFELTRHDETRYAFCHPQMPFSPIAIHEGTSVEAARLFKLLLITRRLAR
jgi:hypothetical protein